MAASVDDLGQRSVEAVTDRARLNSRWRKRIRLSTRDDLADRIEVDTTLVENQAGRPRSTSLFEYHGRFHRTPTSPEWLMPKAPALVSSVESVAMNHTGSSLPKSPPW